jgi:glucose-1-phosphate thymidylyltransferase
MKTRKAVILARGLGSRMKRSDDSAVLDMDQAKAADSGIKAMIPTGRPFLDYVMSALADAGYRDICIVIGPGPEFKPFKDYYGGMELKRVAVSYAIQEEPKGTADAVAAAEDFAAGDDFIVINSDNYYPAAALVRLHEFEGCGTIAFESGALSAGGNIPPERISKYAVLEPDSDFCLRGIVEKPGPEFMSSLAGKIYISMNCWKFSDAIFEACRNIGPSPRGEFELASAIEYAMNSLNVRFRMIPVELPVLDMTGRSDIASVKEMLSGSEVNL